MGPYNESILEFHPSLWHTQQTITCAHMELRVCVPRFQGSPCFESSRMTHQIHTQYKGAPYMHFLVSASQARAANGSQCLRTQQSCVSLHNFLGNFVFDSGALGDAPARLWHPDADPQTFQKKVLERPLPALAAAGVNQGGSGYLHQQCGSPTRMKLPSR